MILRRVHPPHILLNGDCKWPRHVDVSGLCMQLDCSNITYVSNVCKNIAWRVFLRAQRCVSEHDMNLSADSSMWIYDQSTAQLMPHVDMTLNAQCPHIVPDILYAFGIYIMANLMMFFVADYLF